MAWRLVVALNCNHMGETQGTARRLEAKNSKYRASTKNIYSGVNLQPHHNLFVEQVRQTVFYIKCEEPLSKIRQCTIL